MKPVMNLTATDTFSLSQATQMDLPLVRQLYDAAVTCNGTTVCKIVDVCLSVHQ